ncbi:hypothetical protein F5Y14DRAFT_466306 [Nemania sp. NC0429]|nr:hypothetical protein F5Y14DRAFT_466306 [Nemania sp. NC0429]
MTSTNDFRYSSLPRQEAPDYSLIATPISPPASLTSPSPPPSPSLSFTSTLSHESVAAPSSQALPKCMCTTTSLPDPISTTELFPDLRRGLLLRHGFTEQQNSGIGNLLAVVDDVQRRLRTAYATERERGGYFQPDAHRQIIREHKVGDWILVRLGYWEATCAIRRVLGEGEKDGEDGDLLLEIDDGQNTGEGESKDEGVDKDEKYKGVVATLKDFLKVLTALKDKALKDKMQVNKQRYTHTGQWLNFLTIGAGILLYVKNTFFVSPEGIVALAMAGSGAGAGSGYNGTAFTGGL